MAWSTSVIVGIWITCIALLFLVVGFSIPFWYVQILEDSANSKTFVAYTSVWYFMTCEKGVTDSCKSEPIEPKFTAQSAITEFTGDTVDDIVTVAVTVFGHLVYWWVVQIASTVGVGLVLLAALILICCRCAGIHSKGFFIISAILLFFGGLISLSIDVLFALGLGLFLSFVPASGLGISAETFPWSVLLYGIGSLLALVAFVIIMVITCKWKKLGSYYESGDKDIIHENGAPMSNLSKSYDRPRKPADSRRAYDNDRRDESRDFSRSKKYRDTGNRDTGREYTRDYDRQHDQGYNQAYDKAYDNSDRSYSQSRGGDLMYRPYEQYRY